jgi:hypothetical protein
MAQLSPQNSPSAIAWELLDNQCPETAFRFDVAGSFPLEISAYSRLQVDRRTNEQRKDLDVVAAPVIRLNPITRALYLGRCISSLDVEDKAA